MQGPYSAAYKTFRSGLRTYQSKCMLIKFSLVILYVLHLIDLYS
jgi:hypothetical protein